MSRLIGNIRRNAECVFELCGNDGVENTVRKLRSRLFSILRWSMRTRTIDLGHASWPEQHWPGRLMSHARNVHHINLRITTSQSSMPIRAIPNSKFGLQVIKRRRLYGRKPDWTRITKIAQFSPTKSYCDHINYDHPLFSAPRSLMATHLALGQHEREVNNSTLVTASLISACVQCNKKTLHYI